MVPMSSVLYKKDIVLTLPVYLLIRTKRLRSALVAHRLKRLPAMQEIWVWSLGGEDPLEKEMAIHSSILAWRIPWTEEPGGLQSTGSQRVWHDWATSLTQETWWTWVWVNSGSWWWTRKPGVLWFMGSKRVGHNWATELNWTEEIMNVWITFTP